MTSCPHITALGSGGRLHDGGHLGKKELTRSPLGGAGCPESLARGRVQAAFAGPQGGDTLWLQSPGPPTLPLTCLLGPHRVPETGLV